MHFASPKVKKKKDFAQWFKHLVCIQTNYSDRYCENHPEEKEKSNDLTQQ